MEAELLQKVQKRRYAGALMDRETIRSSGRQLLHHRRVTVAKNVSDKGLYSTAVNIGSTTVLGVLSLKDNTVQEPQIELVVDQAPPKPDIRMDRRFVTIYYYRTFLLNLLNSCI